MKFVSGGLGWQSLRARERGRERVGEFERRVGGIGFCCAGMFVLEDRCQLIRYGGMEGRGDGCHGNYFYSGEYPFSFFV